MIIDYIKNIVWQEPTNTKYGTVTVKFAEKPEEEVYSFNIEDTEAYGAEIYDLCINSTEATSYQTYTEEVVQIHRAQLIEISNILNISFNDTDYTDEEILHIDIDPDTNTIINSQVTDYFNNKVV